MTPKTIPTIEAKYLAEKYGYDLVTITAVGADDEQKQLIICRNAWSDDLDCSWVDVRISFLNGFLLVGLTKLRGWWVRRKAKAG